VLRPLHGIFPPGDYPDLLVGLGEPDDAAVWRLDAERALVITTDFFTPVVDNPYDYGAIAAANALSDIYAMGGKPFLALNIAALPLDLPPEIGAEILRGGAEKAREAGVVLAGGHTVQDREPKYGLVVLGFVHPDHILSKGGVRLGDKLVITKPLGFGTVTTALKRDQADPQDVAEAVSWMKRLNKTAAELAAAFSLHGGTDITGFSLLGHALEVAGHSAVGLRFYFDQIPFTRGAQHYAQEWIFPGGSLDNRAYYGDQVKFAPQIEEHSRMLLFDAQTSGGLLLAVPAAKTADFLEQAARLDQPAWVIGEAIEGDGIEVLKDFPPD
jgi:selenide, water dikinase